jgi:hypothetical protein
MIREALEGKLMSGREQEWNFIDPSQLFVEAGSRLPAGVSDKRDPDPDATSPYPKITRLPEGIEVIEQQVGRAVGTWVLQVRCQCGRRWFETEAVDTTHCPRCGMLVYVDVQAGPGPGRDKPAAR